MRDVNRGSNKTWYVYLLCDPDTEQPFYVGKGTGNRMNVHESTLSIEKNLAKKQAILQILAQGKQVFKKKIAEFSVEADAYLYEWAMINLYSDLITNIARKGHRSHPNQRRFPSQEPPPPRKLISLAPAANWLGINRVTLCRWIRRFGIDIHTSKADKRHRYITIKDLARLRYLKEHPEEAGEAMEEQK